MMNFMHRMPAFKLLGFAILMDFTSQTHVTKFIKKVFVFCFFTRNKVNLSFTTETYFLFELKVSTRMFAQKIFQLN